MTRKDYVALAKIFNDALPLAQSTPTAATIARSVVHDIAYDTAAMLAAGNPRFDRARFLKACGVQS
jgi:hypothetical protein